MLAGDLGSGVQKAMEILTALGTIYGADDLVPVTSVQVAGVSYKNLGDAGLEFLADWAAQGARVRVPTTLNPAGLDLDGWRELGFDADFADKQARVIQAFAAMGIRTTCTCTPYFVGNVPRQGDHVAWAESSAVSFANSVLGARTNREGGPSALAAAITGRTPRYGLHLPENRRARLVVDVRCPVQSLADFGALGAMVGRVARNRVPYLKFGVASSVFRVAGSELRVASCGLRVTSFPLCRGPWASYEPRTQNPKPKTRNPKPETRNPKPETQVDLLKALGAAMAASGAVALYHIEGVTPEADVPGIIVPDAETFIVESLAEGYAALDTRSASGSGDGDEIDLVWIGCPHASLAELARVVELLAGRQVRSALWVTMAREVRAEAKKVGLVQALEALGGRVVADTCLVVAPVKELGFRHMATPSGKGAYYAPSHSGLAVHYGALEACIEAAVSGEWRLGIGDGGLEIGE
jgi:predicted aconitase